MLLSAGIAAQAVSLCALPFLARSPHLVSLGVTVKTAQGRQASPYYKRLYNYVDCGKDVGFRMHGLVAAKTVVQVLEQHC